MEHGFGATVELSRKASDWMRAAKAAAKPAMKLVPGQDLLSELRAAAVKEALRTGSGCVDCCALFPLTFAVDWALRTNNYLSIPLFFCCFFVVFFLVF